MIQLYNKGQTDFSTKGITLNAQTAAVNFQDNGRFDLDLTMPVPENITFDYGMILRASVPEQHVPEITLGTVSYYNVTVSGGTDLLSAIPYQKKVSYSTWEALRSYTAGDKVTYDKKNWRCVTGHGGLSDPPPNNGLWTQISGTTTVPGKVLRHLDSGTAVFKTADFNTEYMEAATVDGYNGYVKIADVTATGETETRTIPAQTITAQNFEITEIEKSSDGKKVTLHAEHVSYGLGRTILGECNLVGVNPATAILFIQGAMKESYGGEIYTNLTEENITADWSWKNAQSAILDPKAGLLQFTAGQMIRNDLDVYLITKGEAVPKYQVKYGVNLTAVKYDGSVSSLVTRIYPTAQTEDGDTLLLPEEHIDTVRVVPFIRPEVLNTGLKIGQKETQSDGTEIELTEDIIFTRMREAAYNRFNIDECDKTDISLEVDWIHLPDTEEYKPYAALRNAAPGEWVQVLSGPLGVNEMIQLTGYTFDPILERYEKATFGKNKVSPGIASYDIQTGAISGRALAAGAVGGQNIQANAITAREIEAGSITADKIASRSITAETIAANAITADAISAGSVTAEKIAAHAITAYQIAAHAITADEIAAGAVTADAIASGTIQAVHIMSEAITTDKLAAGSVIATKIAANAITATKLAAGAVTADKIAAGAITAAKIDTTDISAINATLGTADIASAVVGNADISYAKVKDLNAGSAYFGQAVIQEGLANKLFIPRLSVVYAQIVSATIGDLVIQATNDKFYKLDVDLSGNVTATEVHPSQQEIADGHTADGRTIYLGTDIVADDLNTTNIYASHALMDEITANIINVDQLFAREATIGKINAMDLSSNTYIRSTIGNWQSGSTITQTIDGLNTKISQLGYGTVYMQPDEPDHSHLVSGDIWVQTMTDGSWQEIYDNFTSWQQIYDDVSSWQVLGSIPIMWVWDGQRFQQMYDALLPTTMETEIQQLATAITMKASQEYVDILSGEVTEFRAELTLQAQEISSAVSAVNAKAASFVMWEDPRTLYDVSLGDIWIKRDAEGFNDSTTWQDLYDTYASWQELYNRHDSWGDMLGDRTYVWNGVEWVETSDRATEIYQKTLIDQTSTKVTILAETSAQLGDELITQRAQLTVANDRITQEVERATNAENGKISKTSQYQTADAIVSEAVRQSASSASGLYITKTNIYQTADSIVQTAETYASNAADAAEAAAKGACIQKTKDIQTVDALIREAVRQSGVNADGSYIEKTNVYQDAASIVSAAEQYTSDQLQNYSTTQQTSSMISTAVENYVDGELANYSTTQQTSQMIATYVTNNAYGLVSGITITANGVDVSGSQYVKIASGGYFQVTTGDFGIDTNVAATGYAMWAGGASAAESYFRVKKNGEVTLTKLLVLSEDGTTETEANLRTAGLWKLNYSTVKSHTTNSLTLSNGDVINFKTADSFSLSGEWSNGEYVVDMTDLTGTTVYKSNHSGKVTRNKTDAEIKTDIEKSTHKSVISVDDGDGNGLITINVDATGVYSQGLNHGADAVYLVKTWNESGVATIKKSSTGSQKSLVIQVTAGISYDASTHKYTAKANADGSTRATFESGTQAYDAGVSAGSSGVTLTGAWSGSTFTVTNSGNNRTSATTVSFGSTLASIASYLFTAQNHTATMSVKDTARSKTVLTETYDATALYNATYNSGWNGARDGQTVVGTCYRITAHMNEWVKVEEIGTGYSRVPQKQ